MFHAAAPSCARSTSMPQLLSALDTMTAVVRSSATSARMRSGYATSMPLPIVSSAQTGTTSADETVRKRTILCTA